MNNVAGAAAKRIAADASSIGATPKPNISPAITKSPVERPRERAGVPATTIVATSFFLQAAVNAKGKGMADLGVVVTYAVT